MRKFLTIVCAATMFVALFIPGNYAGADTVQVGFALISRDNPTTDFDQWRMDVFNADGDFSVLPLVTEITADQIGPDSDFDLSFLIFAADGDINDGIDLAASRIELNSDDDSSSPLIDFQLSGYLTGYDYDDDFIYAVLYGNNGEMNGGDDIVLTGDPSQSFHAMFSEGFSASFDAAQMASIVEPFNVLVGVDADNQFGGGQASTQISLNVLPAVPEPTAAAGLLLLSIMALRRSHR